MFLETISPLFACVFSVSFTLTCRALMHEGTRGLCPIACSTSLRIPHEKSFFPYQKGKNVAMWMR